MKKILVIDSGIGGLSTLKSIIDLLPNEEYLYIADNLFAPYGTRSKEEVRKRIQSIIYEQNIDDLKCIVIACNTATTSCIDFLRANFSLPIIGIEPAVKVASHKNLKSPLLFATPLTIENLKGRVDKNVKFVCCENLAFIIEKYYGEDLVIYKEIEKVLKDIDIKNADGAILGCTHYSLVSHIFKKVLGENISILDGNFGVSLRVKEVLEKADSLQKTKEKTSSKVVISLTNRSIYDMYKYVDILQKI